MGSSVSPLEENGGEGKLVSPSEDPGTTAGISVNLEESPGSPVPTVAAELEASQRVATSATVAVEKCPRPPALASVVVEERPQPPELCEQELQGV